jgi:hypothetical protein
MKPCLLFALLFLLLGVGRPEAQSAHTGPAKDTDFVKYKTYQWVKIENAQHLDALTEEQLIGTLDLQLAKKGLTKSQSDKPDLWIGYQIAREGDKHISQSNLGASYGSAAGATAATGTMTMNVVHTGQLVLDMYDGEKKNLVWRGVVSNAIEADAKPDKKQKHMDKAVEKLLKDYSPQGR